ncbi:WD40-repeat-containing domain protein [Biscogniauxia sp. FL1348]|nr:WD40-repeat-containing domain protein [Biscogniauxia sp. FL1348]
MEWYIKLPKLFWPDDGTIEPLPSPAAKALIDLYRAILSYMMLNVSHIWNNGDGSGSPHQLDHYVTDIQSLEKRFRNSFDQEELTNRLTRFFEISGNTPNMSISEAKCSSNDEETDIRELLCRLLGDPIPVSALLEKQPGCCVQADEGHARVSIYDWVCSTSEYQTFVDWDGERRCRVLWLHGGPGAGTTMAMEAAVRSWLPSDRDETDSNSPKVAYFLNESEGLYQASALWAVKNLISHIIRNQPTLRHHLRSKFDNIGRKHLDHLNDFYALSTVFYSMIQDADFVRTYFVVEALEQFSVNRNDLGNLNYITNEGELRDPLNARDLKDLLGLISTSVELSGKVQWLLSIDKNICDAKLASVEDDIQCHLTIKQDLEDVRQVLHEYAATKVAEIANSTRYGQNFRKVITAKLQEVSPGNFLWVDVALDLAIMQASRNVGEIIAELKEKAPDLQTLYTWSRNSMEEFKDHNPDHYTRILSAVAIAYQPLAISELVHIINLPPEDDLVVIVETVLSSFLKICNNELQFRHPSARDFILKEMEGRGKWINHLEMTEKCVEVLKETLSRAQEAEDPDDKMAPTSAGYATTFWMKHLTEQDNNPEKLTWATETLENYWIPWLKALDSQGLIQKAIDMMITLDATATAKTPQPGPETIRDIIRFTQFYQTQKNRLMSHEPISTGDGEVTLENSVLFTASRTPLRRTLLSNCFPWLATPPLVELSSTLDEACLHAVSHPDWVRGCCFSPDGRLVVSSSDDYRVRLWDVETGKLQHVLDDFNGYVCGVVMSSMKHDGRIILAAFESDGIKIWEPSTGKLIKRLDGFTMKVEEEDSMGMVDNDEESSEKYEKAYVQDIAITRAGDMLAAAVGNTVAVWELPGFGKPKPWSEHKGSDRIVRRVRFSSDGGLLASTSDSEITIWDSTKAQPRNILQGHENDIDGLAFSPDPKFLASGSDDNTARIWDIESGTTLAVLKYHERGIGAVSFSADGSYLALASDDFTISIWRQKNLGKWGNGEEWTQPSHILRGHTNLIRSVSFAPHSHLLASASDDGYLRVWNTRLANKALPDQSREGTAANNGGGHGHQSGITRLALSPDGKKIASASSDGVVCLWDGVTGDRLCTTEAHGSDVTSLVFSNKTSYLVSVSIDGTAIVWDTEPTEGRMAPKHRLQGHTDWVRGAATSRDERFVATASDDCTVRVWDISAIPHPENQKPDESDLSVPSRAFYGHTDYVYAVAFSPDGTRLASAGDDCHIMVWDLISEDGVQGDKDRPDFDMSDDRVNHYIRGVVFSADGRKVVSVTSYGEIAIWSPGSPEEQKYRLSVDRIPKFYMGKSMTITIDDRHPDFLLTEFGAWQCNDISTVAPDDPLSLQPPPEWSPFQISMDDKWITWKKQELIYLPTEFRPSNNNYWVQDDRVILGCRSGQVLLFRFVKGAKSDVGMVVPRG